MENGQQVVTPEMNRMQTSGGGGVVDPEKEKFIQFQLFLLLHANRCLKNVATNEPNPCTVLHCSTMINVLQHMNTCIEGKRCKFAHCASSRQIISHWKQCKREDCSVCLPFLPKPPSINGPTSIPSPQPTMPEEGVNNPGTSQQMERQPHREDYIDQTQNGQQVVTPEMNRMQTSGRSEGMVGSGMVQQVVTPSANRMQTSGGGGVLDPEKEKLIQQQLFLLLHAHRCLKNVATNEPNPCTVPHCSTMINVLQHMNTCIEGKRCKFAYCASSRQIISHWKQCKREDCSVCLPLKQNQSNSSNPNMMPSATTHKPMFNNQNNTQPVPTQQNQQTLFNQQQQQPQPQQQPSQPLHGTTMALDKNKVQEVLGLNSAWKPDPSGGALSTPSSVHNSELTSATAGQDMVGPMVQPRTVHQWHSQVKDELRNYLVQKLVQNIFPTPDKISMADVRMIKLLSFARKVEGLMYEQASSREEYYHLFAEKIYKIQKELEEKRQKKPSGINGPTSIPSALPMMAEDGVNNPVPSQQMERQPHPEDNIDQTHVSNQPDNINSEQNNTTPVINRHCVGYALHPYPRRSFLARRKLSAKRKAHITRSSNSWDVRDVRRVRFAPKYRTVTRISAKCMQCHMTDTNNLLGQWINTDL